VHNLSSYKPTPVELRVLSLSLGLKHGPDPKTTHLANSLELGLSKLQHSIRIRKLFDEPNDGTPPSPWRQFKLPNPDFQPPLMDDKLETHLSFIVFNIKQQHDKPLENRRYRNNLTHAERGAITSLRNTPDTVIKPADKNLGLTILDSSTYETALSEYIDDNGFLTCILQDLVRAQIHFLALLDKSINYLTPKDDKNGVIYHFWAWIRASVPLTVETKPNSIYLLPKLHKASRIWRPIVAAHSYFTKNFSIWLAKLLQIFEEKLPSYTRYTDHLIQEINTVNSKLKIRLDKDPDWKIGGITGDIDALYPNITIDRLYQVIDEYITRYDRVSDEKVLAFPNPFRTLDNKTKQPIFGFKTLGYVLYIGIPMGNNASVQCSSLYLADMDLRFRQTLQKTSHANHGIFVPLLYKRFDDDLIIRFAYKSNIDLKTTQQKPIEDLNANIKIDRIKITWISDLPNEFLDVALRGNSWTTQLIYCTHQKELNRYLNLPNSSNHPSPTLKGWLRGEALRYARRLLLLEDFLKTCQLFYNRVRARVYSYNFLLPIFEPKALQKAGEKSKIPPDSNPTGTPQNTFLHTTHHRALDDLAIFPFLHSFDKRLFKEIKKCSHNGPSIGKLLLNNQSTLTSIIKPPNSNKPFPSSPSTPFDST